MTKKDYMAIAKIINKFGKVEHMLLLKMCEYFKKDNPNFDADKFLNFLEQREDLSEYPLANSRMIFSRQELEDDPKGDLCIDAVKKEFFSD